MVKPPSNMIKPNRIHISCKWYKSHRVVEAWIEFYFVTQIVCVPSSECVLQGSKRWSIRYTNMLPPKQQFLIALQSNILLKLHILLPLNRQKTSLLVSRRRAAKHHRQFCSQRSRPWSTSALRHTKIKIPEICTLVN